MPLIWTIAAWNTLHASFTTGANYDTQKIKKIYRNRKNGLILIMTPEKQDKTLDLRNIPLSVVFCNQH